MDPTWHLIGVHRFTVSPGAVVLHFITKCTMLTKALDEKMIFQNFPFIASGVLKVYSTRLL